MTSMLLTSLNKDDEKFFEAMLYERFGKSWHVHFQMHPHDYPKLTKGIVGEHGRDY